MNLSYNSYTPPFLRPTCKNQCFGTFNNNPYHVLHLNVHFRYTTYGYLLVLHSMNKTYIYKWLSYDTIHV